MAVEDTRNGKSPTCALRTRKLLASASIITGIAALIWFCLRLGVVGAQLMALGFFALKALTFVG